MTLLLTGCSGTPLYEHEVQSKDWSLQMAMDYGAPLLILAVLLAGISAFFPTKTH